MCSLLPSKADLGKKQEYLSAAHLHFGSESIVKLLLPPSSRFPSLCALESLGETAWSGPQNKEAAAANNSHSNVSQQFLTIPPCCLLPALLPPLLLLSLWAWLRSALTHDYRNAVCGSQLRQPWKSACDVNDGASGNSQKARGSRHKQEKSSAKQFKCVIIIFLKFLRAFNNNVKRLICFSPTSYFNKGPNDSYSVVPGLKCARQSRLFYLSSEEIFAQAKKTHIINFLDP